MIARAWIVAWCGVAAMGFAAEDGEARFLGNVRQLTFEGRRSGEKNRGADGTDSNKRSQAHDSPEGRGCEDRGNLSESYPLTPPLQSASIRAKR